MSKEKNSHIFATFAIGMVKQNNYQITEVTLNKSLVIIFLSSHTFSLSKIQNQLELQKQQIQGKGIFKFLFFSLIQFKIYRSSMNPSNLYPPARKEGENEKGPYTQAYGGASNAASINMSKVLNPNVHQSSKNPFQNTNNIDLSLVQSKPGNQNKRLKHEHLKYEQPLKNTQKNEIPQSLLMNVLAGYIPQSGQSKSCLKNKKKNEAEEEFSKKFKRMYKFPASVSEALVHRRAYRNGFNSSKTVVMDNKEFTKNDTLICPCCQNFVNTIQVPLCQSTYPKGQYKTSENRRQFMKKIKDNYHHQEDAFLFKGGDALFFCFIKLIITFLLLRCVILDAFNLYTNYMGTYCETNRNILGQKDLCMNWWVSVLSTYNNATTQGQGFLRSLDLISLVVTIMSILFCLYGRAKLYELYWYLEKGDITEDDYTILIQNIPPIPFMGNDSLIKDVNQEYKDFIKKLVSNKVRIWLNNFYSYQDTDKDKIEDKLDKQFFEIFQKKKKKDQESELFQNIVTNISLCYDLTELQNLENIRQSLVQDYLEVQGDKQAMENSLFDDENSGQTEMARQYIAHLPHQIEIINQHYVQLCQRISDGILLGSPNQMAAKIQHKQSLGEINKPNKKPVDQLKISRFVGKAFVSFQYEHYKHYLLQKHTQDKDYLKVNGNKVHLSLSHAQKPNDIYWKNMKIADDFRKIQIRNSYILVLVGLLVSTSIMYILRSIQSSIVNSKVQKKSTFDNIILYSIPLWTFLVNYFLDWGIFQLTQSEKHKTKTEELTSLIIKNTAAKFINTSVIYALIFFFGQRVNPLKQNGLVKTIFDLVYVNVGLNLALEFLQPGLIYNNYKNKKYLQRDPKNDKNAVQTVNVFQIKLNKMLEMPTFDFSQAYSYYLQMIYICSFYGFLVPAITPILIVAFGIQYWVDKYNLFRRCSSPIDMGYFLTKLIWNCFEMSLVLFVLGHLVWGSFFQSQQSLTTKILNYTNIGLAVAYVSIVNFFPLTVQRFLSKFASQSELSEQSYNQVYNKFQKTYRAQNPATSFLNQKQEDQSLNKPRISEEIRDEVVKAIINETSKPKLKSLLFVPSADSPQNIEKLQQIYMYPSEYILKCDEKGEAYKQDEKIEQKYEGYSTIFCCL